MDGGSLWLLGLIRDHRGAVEYDLRRFGLGLRDVGTALSLLEASRLLTQIVLEPDSRAGAALRGWAYTVTREQMVLMDLYDRFMEANTPPKKRRPKPYPRPWNQASKRVAKSELSREQTLAALRYAGHTNLPD